jgi:hypothetical protein
MSRFERYRWSGGAGGLIDVGHTTGDRPTTAAQSPYLLGGQIQKFILNTNNLIRVAW